MHLCLMAAGVPPRLICTAAALVGTSTIGHGTLVQELGANCRGETPPNGGSTITQADLICSRM